MQKIIDFSDGSNNEITYILKNECFIFLGAGFSKLVGYKKWDELIQGVIKRFKIDGTINELEYNELLSNIPYQDCFEILFQLNKNVYYKYLKEIFEEDKQNENKEVLKVLDFFMQDDKYKILQTNIDESTEEFFSLKDKHAVQPDLNSKYKLNYLHGKLSSDPTWIFKSQEYANAYVKNGSIKKFLSEIFENYNVLFIGVSFTENYIKDIIDACRNKKRYFALYPVI